MVATVNLRILFGETWVRPASLTNAEWSNLLETAAYNDLTMGYIRGLRSIRKILQSTNALRIRFWARPSIVRAGMRDTGFELNDVFLYCTTVSDGRFPQNTLAERARKGEPLSSSDVVLSKKGGFWRLDADWRYTEPSKDMPNPWSLNTAWLEAERIVLEYLGYGHGPLGNLCMEFDDDNLSPKHFGVLILNSLYQAQQETTKDLERRRAESRRASEKLKSYLERLGERVL